MALALQQRGQRRHRGSADANQVDLLHSRTRLGCGCGSADCFTSTALSSITSAGARAARTTRALARRAAAVSAAPGVWPDGKPNSTGPGKPRDELGERRPAPAPAPPGSSHPGKSPNTMRRGACEHAGQPQLRPQPVEPVRPLVHVLEEQHAALGRIERERRAQRRGQLREVAAEERPARLARRRAPRVAGEVSSPSGVGRGEGADQRAPRSYAPTPPLQPAGDGRPVERDEAARHGDERQQRREVAVADDRLAGVAHERRDRAAAARARCRSRRAPPSRAPTDGSASAA